MLLTHDMNEFKNIKLSKKNLNTQEKFLIPFIWSSGTDNTSPGFIELRMRGTRRVCREENFLRWGKYFISCLGVGYMTVVYNCQSSFYWIFKMWILLYINYTLTPPSFTTLRGKNPNRRSNTGGLWDASNPEALSPVLYRPTRQFTLSCVSVYSELTTYLLFSLLIIFYSI